ncbi:MAG: helix-turn-helix transcriptional regulator [Gallionellaceae bacterium]|nr:helix-turn-helix transcriptional regulator [Gallionellaceae bacterium]
MTEAVQLIATLKKQLKNQGMTYRDVARALKLSEPSVKRLFASGRFSVERLVQISNLLGYTLAELSKEAQTGQTRLSTLTEKQEREVVSDPKLLMVAVCALNHWTPDEIVAFYKLGIPECIKYLLQLDRLRIIDLLPGNRIRLNVARDFDWLPSGPIRQYFQSKGINDFLKSEFAHEDETLTFVHGMFTDQALAQIQDEMRRLRLKFAELHEQSLAAPLSKRRGLGLLLAMRGWEPADFSKLRR